MSLLARARYHAGYSVFGRALLRAERLRSERQLARPDFWRSEHLAPPLNVAPRLKELISRHYLKGRFVEGGQKVAWVTSGAPIEFLSALDYFLIYPENHGAVCGIRRTAEDLCGVAEDAGWSRDTCSYARTDFGAMLSGRTPVGKLPRPDLLVCCTNICQTVLLWYRVLANHFKVPLVVIDTPFIYTKAGSHDTAFVERQLEDAIGQAEAIAGRDLDPKRLREVTVHARDAVKLWSEVMARGAHKPAPLTAFDQFIHMAPIVEMRGQAFTVAYYQAMLDELDERIAKGIGALKNERRRLVWDNLPVWHRLSWLSKQLAGRGVALVASTYTNAWGELAELIDPDDPIASAAACYMHPILNLGTGRKLETIKKLVLGFEADGVILHSDRSCKPYSIGQMDQRERLGREIGAPALLLEADHNDPRAFSEEQATARLEAFLEMIDA